MKPNLELKSDITRKYLEYKIMPDDIIDSFSEGMLKNNEIKGVLSISFQQIDDQRFYYFDTSYLISMKQFIKNDIQKKDLIHIFISIIDTYLSLNDYLIEDKCLLLNIDDLYIDQVSKDVKCVCLPLTNLEKNKTIYEFIREMMMSVRYSNEDNSYITKILNYINSSSDSPLEDLKNFLIIIDNENNFVNQISQQTVISSKNSEIKSETPITIEEKKIETPIDSIPRDIKIEKQMTSEKPIKAIVKKQKEIGKEIPKNSKGRIPTLKKRNIEDSKEEPKKPVKEKKRLFGNSKKEEKDQKKLSKIPSKKNKESKIPTMSKRISGEEAKKSLTGGIQREVKPTYQEDITQIQTAGTTVLGEGTTVLGVGTTVLSDTTKHSYGKLTRISTQQSIVITVNNFRIGKDESNSFAIIDNSTISRQHAEIISKEGRFYITDLNSTNKTYVDGIRVKPGSFIEIFDGSRIKLANEDLIFQIVEEVS